MLRALLPRYNYNSQGPEEESLSSNFRNQDFAPSSNAGVFAANFPPDAFVTEDTLTKSDGSTLTVKRYHVKLVEDAYPSIFPK